MYTIHCEDPNCVKCKQASKGQSSEERNQSKIPETLGQSSEEESQQQLLKTVEDVVAKDLLFAGVARGKCLSTCSMLKEEVHHKINALMNVLRERELDLCIEIEKEYSAQVLKIDHDVTANCVDKIKKRYDENKRPHSKTTLVFDSDFDALKRRLKCFGKLRYEDTEEVSKKWIQELRDTVKRWDVFSAMAEDASPALSSGSPFGVHSKATSGAEDITPVDLFEVDYKTTFSAKNASLVSSDLAKYRNMNGLQLKKFRRELEEQNRRLNKISLERKKDSKINCKDELSVDLGTLKEIKQEPEEQNCRLNKISLESKKDSKINSKDGVSEVLHTGWKTSAGAELEELFVAFNESLVASPTFMQQVNEEEKRRRYQLKLQLLQKKGSEVIASGTMKDKIREEMAYQGFESTDSVPNKEVGMDSSSKRKLELVHEILQREISADEIADRISAVGIEKCGEDNSLGKDSCKIKTLHQQLTGKDEPETLSVQIKKRFEVLANRTMKDQKRGEMAFRGFESTDSVPIKEVGKDSSSKKDFVEELWAKLPVTDLKKDQIASESTDSSSSEEVEKDSSLDEDDIEIISRIETESIPSELSFSPPLPPKNRFKFGRKPSCFGSLLRKKEGRKPAHSPRDSAKSESSGESESQTSSLMSAVSSGSNAEMKENPSFNEQSSSECLGGSKDEGQDISPTVALRSSFTKYLEKNPESEWLAPRKSSEQSPSAGNSGKERVVPIFVHELDQWLPRECNQKMTSDWLYPAHI